MRQALVLLGALALVGSAAASGPPVKNLPFKVAVPKHGTAMYAFKLTVKFPSGTTFSGDPPISVVARNRQSLAKNVQAAGVAIEVGNGVWQIFIAIDASNASGSGAATLSGAVEVPPPLSSNPTVISPEQGACNAWLEIIGEKPDYPPNYTLIVGKKTTGAKGIVGGACP